MTPLRKRFLEDMPLKGLSERTRDYYAKHVSKPARHYMKSPEALSEEDIRGYFLHMKNVKRYSECFFKQSLSAVKFLFTHTLHRPWTLLDFVIPRKVKKLPDILSVPEFRALLASLRLFRYHAVLTAIYSLGLRLGEGTNLRVADIDSARMLVHVHHGKRAPGTGSSLCRSARWPSCANSGKPIVTPPCSTPLPAGGGPTARTPRTPCPAVPFRPSCARRFLNAASKNECPRIPSA